VKTLPEPDFSDIEGTILLVNIIKSILLCIFFNISCDSLLLLSTLHSEVIISLPLPRPELGLKCQFGKKNHRHRANMFPSFPFTNAQAKYTARRVR
jgi:hypothetical protein